MNTNLMFSSECDTWETPQDFFEKLNKVFPFDFDVCALPSSAKCPRFFDPEDNALVQNWYKAGDCLWMNPPYGRGIGQWMKKAYEESQKGVTVVCLVPARTDTRWWHDYAIRGEISYVKGRLKFGGSPNSAPFPSAVVVFRTRLPEYI